MQRPFTFDRVVRIILSVALLGAIFYLLVILKSALLPFVVAWLLAYLLNPIVVFFQTKLRLHNRVASVLATLFTVIAILVGIGFLVVPMVIGEFNRIVEIVHNFSVSSAVAASADAPWYTSLLERVKDVEIDKIINPDEWRGLLEGAMTNLWSVLSGSISQILNFVSWLIVIIYLVFIMIDFDKIGDGFRKLIPQKYRETSMDVLSDVEEGMSRYFRGQSLVALLVGILFSIGFLIIGLPMAIPLGLFIGLLNLVPYLQIIGIVPTVLLCFLSTHDSGESFWVLFALSMLVFAVVQMIQDIVIVPKIMGKVTGLNPAVILLSLSVWGTLMGVMGMIIALPMTTLLLSYYKRYIIHESSEEPNHPQNE